MTLSTRPEFRESLIARGYEYVERNGWSQKKQEYVDLIDSLSTEYFADVHPHFSGRVPEERRYTADYRPKVKSTGTLHHDPGHSAPASLLEKN